MKPARIDAFLTAIGTKAAGASDKFVQAPCPLSPWRHSKGSDKHPSFGVSLEPGQQFAHCFSCGYSGSLTELAYTIHDLEKREPTGRKLKIATAFEVLADQDAEDPLLSESESTIDEFLTTPPKSSVIVFPESLLEGMEPAYTDTEVHPYLATRAINCNTARRMDLRWDAKRERIVFPLRDFHGRLCGARGRTVLPYTEPRYYVYKHQNHSNSLVWFGEHWLDFDKLVVVVESVFDAAAVYPIWPNVVCPLSATFPLAMLDRLDGVTRVVSLFDNDTAGTEARNRLGLLKSASVTHLSCEPYKDPGEMPAESIAGLLYPFLMSSDFSLAQNAPF